MNPCDTAPRHSCWMRSHYSSGRSCGGGKVCNFHCRYCSKMEHCILCDV